MRYIESEIIELKSTLTEDTKNEIIAFLNSYLGGTIYIGVNNKGEVLKYDQKQNDLFESKIINWIRDEAIYPNCSEYISIKTNKDGVLTISILPGNDKPYYLKEKGPKPSGVYIRYGRNKSQASKEEITRMIMEANHTSYELGISEIQKLTFITLKLKFEEKHLNFESFKMITSGFVRNNKYTNLAFIFSDQYDVETKIGVYYGLDRALFKSKKEFNGSILKQIDKTLEYYELCNETRIVIDGSPTRKEYKSYNIKAAREAILNCYCHRDYSRNSNIKIEFFDDRCEIISPGGFYGGLTLNDALNGIQSFRNKYLVILLHKLGYIENYSSGINRIFKEYDGYMKKPIILSELTYFKIIFPNLNYDLIGTNEPNREPNEPNCEPNNSDYEPNHEPNEPNLEPNNGDYEPNREPNEPNCEPNNGDYEPNHEPNEPNCEPNNGDYELNHELNEPNCEPNNGDYEPNREASEPNLEINYLDKIELEIIYAFKENPKLSISQLSIKLSKSVSTIKRIIIHLKNKNLIYYEGKKRNGEWKIKGAVKKLD